MLDIGQLGLCGRRCGCRCGCCCIAGLQGGLLIIPEVEGGFDAEIVCLTAKREPFDPAEVRLDALLDAVNGRLVVKAIGVLDLHVHDCLEVPLDLGLELVHDLMPVVIGCVSRVLAEGVTLLTKMLHQHDGVLSTAAKLGHCAPDGLLGGCRLGGVEGGDALTDSHDGLHCFLTMA